MKRQRGQTLVLVALMMVVLLAFVALALDGGNAYLQRRQMQTAADAGALAGAKLLCLNKSEAEVKAEAEALCARNQSLLYSGWECKATVSPGGARLVNVVARVNAPTWFAGVLGVNSIEVAASAEAACSPLVWAENLLPLAVMAGMPGCVSDDIADCFETNQTYEIWDKEDNAYRQECQANPLLPQCDDNSGAFGFLRWDDSPCGSGSILKPSILNLGCAPPIYVPEVVCAEPGGELGGVKSEMATWCNQDVVVPLYRYTADEGCGGRGGYLIEGFGMFHMTGICTGQGKPECPGQPAETCSTKTKKVIGYFKEAVVPGFGDPYAPDTGVYVVHLTR